MLGISASEWGVVIGAVLPPVIAVVNRETWSTRVKAIVAFIAVLIATAVGMFATGQITLAGVVDVNGAVALFERVITATLVSYKALWQPTGASSAIERNVNAGSTAEPPLAEDAGQSSDETDTLPESDSTTAGVNADAAGAANADAAAGVSASTEDAPADTGTDATASTDTTTAAPAADTTTTAAAAPAADATTVAPAGTSSVATVAADGTPVAATPATVTADTTTAVAAAPVTVAPTPVTVPPTA